MDFLRDSYQSTFIATGATTAVTGASTGPGTCKLIRIIVGETAGGAIRVFDSVPGSETASNQKAELKSSVAEGDFDYGITMAKGIQVVTLAASKITVVWSKV